MGNGIRGLYNKDTFTMKVPDGSCGSAIGAEQLTFIYGDVADRRHVRLIEENTDEN